MTPPDLETWAALSVPEKQAFGERLAKDLPTGFAFAGVIRHELGQIAREVAHFTLAEAKGPAATAWVFVPGGEARLGFDAMMWEPEAEERDSWAGTAEGYGLAPDPIVHLKDVLTPVRTAVLPPLLVEAESREVGWRPADPTDALVKEVLALGKKHLRGRAAGGSSSIGRDGRDVRVRRDEARTLIAEEADDLTPERLAATVRAGGFRYPTDDEWERLCDGGAKTLWRWGEHAPMDRYPTDVSPAEARWRTAWALSGGTLDRPAEGFETDWDLHLRPNALGLCIAQNPYQQEVVENAAGEVVGTRGGDGGCMLCGGAGFLAGWLPLATAWREPDFCGLDSEVALYPGHTFGRRVLELG
ncbi:hypothetical protein [Alienimonas chondri]|uniref:Sulfatase-modifying factor enzyme domain-containing protein n=1 Tax=Alienimonas chondri TaxID=2681879 RepID=A0ABX1VKL9_9PLAN|nr:hypothetical protein [Alienimonas chondri]NNJ27256.1 hypothetical protein [Alienimonas chondri]